MSSEIQVISSYKSYETYQFKSYDTIKAPQQVYIPPIYISIASEETTLMK
jgi:hypothetical protein